MADDPSNATAAPTVVVARRLLPGFEDRFREWDRRIRAAASSHDGFVNSEIQPPNPSHPGEWVTVYSFATVEQLDGWLRSDERAGLMSEVDVMLDGAAKEQRVAGMKMAPEPVTLVLSQRIDPGNVEVFVELHDEGVQHLRDFKGFLGSDLFPPVEGVQDEYVIVATFASRPDLDRWLQSDTRREWLDELELLIEGDRTLNVVGGFGGWFPAQAADTAGPKRWKQAVAVFIALFPTVLIITFVRGVIAPDMNVVLAVFVGNVLGIFALTYVLMPPLTRLLANWLTR